MGNIITTYSGVELDLSDLRPEMITVDDIAHGLSNTCRFGGHCREFYSVAQHSVIVSELVDQEHALAALLHDAAEAYLGDIPSPLKRMLPDYRALEERVEAVIFEKFGVPYPLPETVKRADLQALAVEKRDLLRNASGEWPMLAGIETPEILIIPEPPVWSKRLWLARFCYLTGAL